MEAIIKIEDKKTFMTLIQFLKSVNIKVEAKNENLTKNKTTTKKRFPLENTLLKYDNPYGPATAENEWDIMK